MEYKNGVAQFLSFASQHKQRDGTIVCPCRKCAHSTMLAIDVVRIHLVSHGICRGYRRWIFHGESSSRKTSVQFKMIYVLVLNIYIYIYILNLWLMCYCGILMINRYI